MNKNRIIKILLIEDNPADARLITELLKESEEKKFEINRTETLYDGLTACADNKPDCLLLDLHLPDGHGLETFNKLHNLFDSIPVIILTGLDDNDLALQAINRGSQDFLNKNDLNSQLLIRTIKYAIERNELLLQKKEEIKQRVEAEEKANKYLRELQDNFKIREKLYSAMTHDLRSPMTGMIGYAEILYEDHNEMERSEKEDIIAGIYSLSRNFYELFENFLSWINVEMNMIPHNPGYVPLNSVIDSTLALYDLNLRKKNIRINKILDGYTKVFADRNHVQLIARNLISNAIKFSYNGGEINVSSKDHEDKVELIIADNGIGFNGERSSERSKNFKLNTSNGTEGEKGTGLGLLLVDEFMKINNGEYSYSSRINEGTTFNLIFPKEGKE